MMSTTKKNPLKWKYKKNSFSTFDVAHCEFALDTQKYGVSESICVVLRNYKLFMHSSSTYTEISWLKLYVSFSYCFWPFETLRENCFSAFPRNSSTFRVAYTKVHIIWNYSLCSSRTYTFYAHILCTHRDIGLEAQWIILGSGHGKSDWVTHRPSRPISRYVHKMRP